MAGTTPVKFTEAQAQQTVDWTAISKDINTALTAKATEIETQRAAIEKNTQEFITTLNSNTQSENRSVKEWAMDGANSIQEQALILKRNLKNGRMKQRDYTIQMQNLTDGGTQLGQVVKSYNEQWKKKMDRMAIDPKTGLPQAQSAEAWMMEQIEGFSNFKASGIFVNPLNSQINIGKRILVDPSKPFNADKSSPNYNPYSSAMSQNPTDYAQLPALLSRTMSEYNYYDANTAVQNKVNEMGKVVESLQKGKVETYEDALQSQDYKNAESAWIQSTRAGSNITNVTSVLMDNIGINPNTGNEFKFTQDVALANTDEDYILMSQDDVPLPVFDQTGANGDKQLKVYDEFMQTMMRGELNKIETARKIPKQTKADIEASSSRKAAEASIPFMQTLYSADDEATINTALAKLSQRAGGKARFEVGEVDDDELTINFITYTEDKTKPGTYLKTEHPKTFRKKGKTEQQFVTAISSTMSDYANIDDVIAKANLGTTTGAHGLPGKRIKWGTSPQKATTWSNIGQAYKQFQYSTAKDLFEAKDNNSLDEAVERTNHAFDRLARHKANAVEVQQKSGQLVFSFPNEKGKNKKGYISMEWIDDDASKEDQRKITKLIFDAMNDGEDVTADMLRNLGLKKQNVIDAP